MKNAPSLRTVENVVQDARTCQKQIDSRWVPARSMGFYSLLNRLKLAWGVFAGKYDALKWEGQ